MKKSEVPQRKKGPNDLNLEVPPDEMPEDFLAHAVLNPPTRALFTMHAYPISELGGADATTMLDDLKQHVAAIQAGNLSHMEAMLVSQAETLNAMFHHLAKRAQVMDYEHMEPVLRLALRSQALCRANIEALAAIKNPVPVAFVKQANIANGPQQVNNGDAANLVSGKNKNSPIKLLELDHGRSKRMDTSATRTPKEGHSKVAAMEQVNRPAKRARKGGRSA